MCIGFSQYHNAVEMNSIANCGNERGNFMYVNTDVGNYQQAINEALGDSFDIALGCTSDVKFKITNQAQLYEVVSGAEINYVAVTSAEDKKTDAEDSDELPNCEVLVTIQQIQKTCLLDEHLEVIMQTATGEHECKLAIEACDEPESELKLKAQLQFTKQKLFDYV